MLRLCPCQNNASSKNCNHLRIRIRYVLNIFFLPAMTWPLFRSYNRWFSRINHKPRQFSLWGNSWLPSIYCWRWNIFFSEICLKYPDKICFAKLFKKYFDARTRWSSSSWTTQQHSSPHYAGEVSFLWRYKP